MFKDKRIPQDITGHYRIYRILQGNIRYYRILQGNIRYYTGFLSGFWSRGVEIRCNVLLGGILYYIPESKAYDKLGETGIMLHCAKHNQHA